MFEADCLRKPGLRACSNQGLNNKNKAAKGNTPGNVDLDTIPQTSNNLSLHIDVSLTTDSCGQGLCTMDMANWMSFTNEFILFVSITHCLRKPRRNSEIKAMMARQNVPRIT